MKESSAIPYSKLPSLAGFLARALIRRKPGLKDMMSLEKIKRYVSGAKISSEAFAAFTALCGFVSSTSIPLAYYYILAQRIQLALLTDPAFPLGIAGLVHIDNSFRQYTQASLSDTFDMECRIDGDRIVPAGREFEIVTDFFVNTQKVLECRSRFLSRNRSRTSAKKPKMPSLPLEGERTPLYLSANAGRRYAKVSGDYNPIHLYPWSARLFGFRQPIAQGIYMLSLISSRLEERFSWANRELMVEYKLPVYLPGEVDLIASCMEDDKTCRFEVRSGNDEKLHLKGSFS